MLLESVSSADAAPFTSTDSVTAPTVNSDRALAGVHRDTHISGRDLVKPAASAVIVYCPTLTLKKS